MTEVLIGLTLAYVFVVILLLIVLIRSNMNWVVKALLVVLAMGMNWYTYQTWQGVQGWPSPVAMPTNFLLHYAVIDEPNQKKGTKGHLYVWASEISKAKPSEQPRAYELPYTTDLHAKLESAMRKIGNGQLQMGRITGGETKNRLNVRDYTRIGDKSAGLDLEFSNLPDPQLPEK